MLTIQETSEILKRHAKDALDNYSKAVIPAAKRAYEHYKQSKQDLPEWDALSDEEQSTWEVIVMNAAYDLNGYYNSL